MIHIDFNYLLERNQLLFNEDMAKQSKLKVLSILPVQRLLQQKKAGLPYRDARLFLYEFLGEKGLVDSEHVPTSAKEVNKIVGNLMTKGKITPELAAEFEQYTRDNIEKFIRKLFVLRRDRAARGRKGIDPLKSQTDYRPVFPDEVDKQQEIKQELETTDISDFTDTHKLLFLKASLVGFIDNTPFAQNLKHDDKHSIIDDFISKVDSASSIEQLYEVLIDLLDSPVKDMSDIAAIAIAKIRPILTQNTGDETQNESYTHKYLLDFKQKDKYNHRRIQKTVLTRDKFKSKHGQNVY